MMAARTKEELIAACAVHGHPPYNNATCAILDRHRGDAEN
jgi:hypothetical protein